MEPSDKDIWDDFSEQTCTKYSIDIKTFHTILVFVFGDIIEMLLRDRQYNLLLNFSAAEIYKGIRRVKPKLHELTELRELRKRYPESTNPMKPLEETGIVTKVNGVWRQK